MSLRSFRVSAVFVFLCAVCPAALAQEGGDAPGVAESVFELLKPAVKPEPVEAQGLAAPPVSSVPEPVRPAAAVPVTAREATTRPIPPVAAITRPAAPARPVIEPVPAGLRLVAPGAGAAGGAAISSGPVKPCRFPAMLGGVPQEGALKATGRPWRVLGPGEAAKKGEGFQPDRINLFTDGRGIVSRVECW